MQRVRCLIVDDEPLARRGIRKLLRQFSDFEVVGSADSVSNGIAEIIGKRPDVVFLDVQMPGGTGFDTLDAIPDSVRPLLVFTTGHGEYAIRALRSEAIDYLLKPISSADFAQAIERVRYRLGLITESAGLGDQLNDELEASESSYAVRLVVHKDARTSAILEVQDVILFLSARNYIRVFADTGSYLIRETMKNLEGNLDPTQFIRIHRRAVVNVQRISELQSDGYGGLFVLLSDGKKVPVGRRYRSRIREMWPRGF